MTKTAFIILGAGKGVRMVSDLPKVMHPVGGVPMIKHLLHTVKAFNPEKVVCVIGPGMDILKEAIKPAETVVQEVAKGTGHAALMAKPAVDGFDGLVYILYGDAPLLSAETIQKMKDKAEEGYQGVVLGFRTDNPKRYGRLIMSDSGELQEIVEYKDATEEQRKVNFCNSGPMCVDGKILFKYLEKIKNENASKEYYLTDIVKLMREDGLKFSAVEGDISETEGANTRAELADLEKHFQTKAREKAMAAGVTLQDPATTYFSLDTEIGKDTVVEPCVYFGPGVKIGEKEHVKAFTRLEKK